MADAGGVPGYIMAGGRSSRFGSDKARALVGGTPMIRRVADALAPVCRPVLAVAEAAGKHDDLGVVTIAETHRGAGPMGGVLSALEHRLAAYGPGWVFVSACDTPWLTPAVARAVLGARVPGLDAVCPRTDRLEPMAAAYHTGFVARLSVMIEAGDLALHRAISGARSEVLHADAAAASALRQGTRPEDLVESDVRDASA